MAGHQRMVKEEKMHRHDSHRFLRSRKLIVLHISKAIKLIVFSPSIKGEQEVVPAVQHHHLTWRPEACLPVKSTTPCLLILLADSSILDFISLPMDCCSFSLSESVQRLRGCRRDSARSLKRVKLAWMNKWHEQRSLTLWQLPCHSAHIEKKWTPVTWMVNGPVSPSHGFHFYCSTFSHWRHPAKPCWDLTASCCWRWTWKELRTAEYKKNVFLLASSALIFQ